MTITSGRIPLFTDPITRENAVSLVFNFLNESALTELSNIAIGGTFPISEFKLSPGYLAKQFWFCYNSVEKDSNRKFFLAIENSSKSWPRNMKEENVPANPENTLLFKPTSTFKFEGNYTRTVYAEVKAFMENFVDPNKNLTQISSKVVRKYAWSFAALFEENSRGFCEYPLAYFENYDPINKTCFIDEFIAQCSAEIKHVRYFFGLDDTNTYHPNRIRIILCPVGADGKIILKKDSKDKDTDTFMLQHSWPPPPPIL
jgi:hypothetical protein